MSHDAAPTRTSLSLTQAIAFALGSPRARTVALLSFSSGLPLGLVWIAIPDWMRASGVDIRLVGLIQLTHLPWSFKVLWAPLMDRYPLPWLGRRRGWIAVCQVALVVATLALSGVGGHGDAPWIVLALCLAIAVASASQDIVIDAYTVDVLHPDELGVTSGTRIAVYRVAMLVSGGLAVSLVAWFGWAPVSAFLALLYVPLLIVTMRAPEPDVSVEPPPSLREAIWLPFLGFLGRHRALEILAFVLTYKLADNLAEALLRPFLNDMGYAALHRGIGITITGTTATLAGSFFGGALTSTWGLGRCLWIFGGLQIFSNVGYLLLANFPPNLPLLYATIAFENVTKGLGMGAFAVLLIKLTQRRFSATQYALFSSLFGLPRVVSGPTAGFIVHAVGWTPFFWFTMVMGIPGLLLLARFVPPTAREPRIAVEAAAVREPLTVGALVGRGLAGGLVTFAFAIAVLATLAAFETLRVDATAAFDLLQPARAILVAADLQRALELAGSVVFGVAGGLVTAAVAAARRGGSASVSTAPEE